MKTKRNLRVICLLAAILLPAVAQAQFGYTLNGGAITITGYAGQTVVVDAATNLVHPAWQPVYTNTLASGFWYFSDPKWMNYPARFYRLRSP